MKYNPNKMVNQTKKNKKKQIIEGKTKIKIYTPQQKDVSKKLEVFYNPVMKLNRDISLEVLRSFDFKDKKQREIKIALPLAGSGVRGVRILNELKEKNFMIYFNDLNSNSIKLIKENIKLNKLKKEHYKIFNKDANIFLLEQGKKNKKFDYVDIDPFGSPNPFLDAAIKSTKRNGILAITATDTAPLSGTYPKTCLRKYWSKPMRNELMHEIGLRILIRKAQLIGAQYDKALIPLLSYSKDHYFRVFFKVIVGKKEVNKIIKQHGSFEWFEEKTGDIWLGSLGDSNFIKKIKFENEKQNKFIETLQHETKIQNVGFYHIPSLCKRKKISSKMKIEEIILKLKEKGFKASRTHFNPQAIKSNCNLKDIYLILK